MPYASKRQERLMNAAAHDAKFASKVGVPQSVAREFVSEDEKKAHGRKRVAEAMMSSHKSKKY